MPPRFISPILPVNKRPRARSVLSILLQDVDPNQTTIRSNDSAYAVIRQGRPRPYPQLANTYSLRFVLERAPGRIVEDETGSISVTVTSTNGEATFPINVVTFDDDAPTLRTGGTHGPEIVEPIGAVDRKPGQVSVLGLFLTAFPITDPPTVDVEGDEFRIVGEPTFVRIPPLPANNYILQFAIVRCDGDEPGPKLRFDSLGETGDITVTVTSDDVTTGPTPIPVIFYDSDDLRKKNWA